MIEVKNNCIISGGTLLSCRKTDRDMIIPPQNGELSSVYRIGSGALMNDRTIQNLTIGNEITEIGEKAFAGCKALRSVQLPGSIRKMERSAFINTDLLKYISFYIHVSEKKYQEILESGILLSNGEYLLDPMILGNDLREWIASFMPDIMFDSFPVDETMGYFFSKNKVYIVKSFLEKRGLSELYEMRDEASVMKYRILNGEEQFLLIDEDKELEKLTQAARYELKEKIPSTAFIFLTGSASTGKDERILHLYIRRESYYYHTADKVIMDGKTYYVCFRVYFHNSRPTYVRQDSSMYITTKEGRLDIKDQYYNKVLKKYNFTSKYL